MGNVLRLFIAFGLLALSLGCSSNNEPETQDLFASDAGGSEFGGLDLDQVAGKRMSIRITQPTVVGQGAQEDFITVASRDMVLASNGSVNMPNHPAVPGQYLKSHRCY